MSNGPRAAGAKALAKSAYRVPAVLAAVIIAGLLAALIGDGCFDVASWIAFAIPLGMLLRHLLK